MLVQRCRDAVKESEGVCSEEKRGGGSTHSFNCLLFG